MFVLMTAHMMVVPFIASVLVADHGVGPAQISWVYAVGGIAPFFISRYVGRLSDRFGHRTLLRVMLLVSMLPVLFVTHLPPWPFAAMIAFFPFFMMAMSARMVPLQALLITVPEPRIAGRVSQREQFIPIPGKRLWSVARRAAALHRSGW